LTEVTRLTKNNVATRYYSKNSLDTRWWYIRSI